jgi:[ribosomal protein S5]-alanine N-acetyltransferase
MPPLSRRTLTTLPRSRTTDAIRACRAPHHGKYGRSMEPITTARLVIRPFESSDIDDFLSYQSHPDVRRFLPGEALTPAEAAVFITTQSELAESERDRWHDWAVQHLIDGRVIGDVGVYLPSTARTEGDLGFQFHPGYHGFGLAREATGALLEHLFGTMALTRITASCHEKNEPSARLLLDLGMVEVAGEQPDDRSFELVQPPT